jgi:hypothetical protein
MDEATEVRKASEALDRLRRTRQQRVDELLHDEMVRQAPGNAVYWVAVVIGSFVLNVLVLLAVAH